MGLFFTIIYIVTAYLAPATVFGSLADAHIQIVIALIALGFGMFSLEESQLGRMVQTYAIMAFSLTVALATMFNGWLGGGPKVMMEFLPNAFAFYLVVLNCRSKRHLQILVASLFGFAAFVIYIGGMAQSAQDVLSPYLLVMKNEEGVPFFRLRGLGFLNDPNDLAQFLVGLIPCMFLFWSRKKRFSNLLLVYVPVSVLLYGMFLSHSRGGMVALLAATIIAGRRKFGILPATIVGAVMFAGLSVVGWSGGREVNADSGADRMEAWSTGLTLIRSHPIFGIGYERFNEYFYITAHNTIIVCAAELGLTGLFCWMLFVLPTVRNAAAAANSTSPPKKPKQNTGMDVESLQYAPERLALATPYGAVKDARDHSLAYRMKAPEVPLATPADDPAFLTGEEPDPNLWSRAEIHRLNNLMLISLTGFLTAGWFLSRPYAMTLYVFAAIAAVVYRISSKQPFTARPLPLRRTMQLAALASVIGVLIVYVIIRVQHMTGG